MPKKDVSLKNRVMALIFIFILLGSTVAYAVLSIFGPRNQQTFSIPKERILNYELSQEQIDFLVSRYITIIKYDYPSNCLNCLEVKKTLEDITQNSDNQIFLQEIETDMIKPKLYVYSILNETTIENPTPDMALSSICRALVAPTTWCVINQV